MLERGARMSARGGMRYASAYTRLLQGRLLVETAPAGQAGGAREVLQQAHADAAAGGYSLLERRAAAELSKLA